MRPRIGVWRRKHALISDASGQPEYAYEKRLVYWHFTKYGLLKLVLAVNKVNLVPHISIVVGISSFLNTMRKKKTR